MFVADNLKRLLIQQKGLTCELEKEITNLDANNLVVENDSLKKEIAICSAQLGEARVNNAKLTEENASLKNELYDQLYNEKIAILNAVNKKVDVYYLSNIQGGLNRLNEFEIASKRRIDEIAAILYQNRVSSEDEIYARLNELGYILNQKVTAARQEFARQEAAYSQNKAAALNNMRQEGLYGEEVKRALKKNNLESLIGLNIINKLGIMFLIIGVIAAMQFTYYRLPDVFKSIFAFAVGVIFLILGEFLNRKKANVFSLGMTSCGVAVLYAALAISYFGLNILDTYLALILCVAITVLSFLLSQRYHSQTIATFSLVGGYLPIFSISGNQVLIYSAMVYFIILNLLALTNSFHKKWTVTAMVGFVLNVIGTEYIMSIVLFSDYGSSTELGLAEIITLIYIAFAFVIYTLIPIMSSYYNKIMLKSIDITLLALNTFVSAIFLYISFYQVKLDAFTGLLALLFAVIYFFLGKFAQTRLSQQKRIQTLFYLSSFTFVLLIIPFQFDLVWLSLGWLIEGVVLVTYGILRDDKKFRLYGYIAGSLCLAVFILFDLLPGLLGDRLFVYKYLAVTLGSIVIMMAYAYKKSLFNKGVLALKYCTTINLWLFMLYIVMVKLYDVIHLQISFIDKKDLFSSHLQISFIDKKYLFSSLCITIGFLLAYIIPRIRALSDFGMKLISMIIYGISIYWLFMINGTSSPFRGSEVPFNVTVFGTSILIIVGLLSVLATMDLVKHLVTEAKLSTEWYPLIVSIYFVVILTQNLISQYHLAFTDAAYSIIYIITAFSWIVLGFIKRYTFIRRFGLGLSFFAIAKLFLMDLYFLSKGYRIISYFAFGITLIAISFVYQYFNKRLETKVGTVKG